MNYLFLLLVWLQASLALAAPAKVDDPKQPTLIGGTVADPAKWPSSIYVSMGNARCSATIIGEHTIILAAHCVDDGGKATFTLAGSTYSGTCTNNPAYPADISADWSLCVLNKKVTGRAFETVATATAQYSCKKNDTVRMTGFGCTKPDGTGGNDGSFRIGEAPITKCNTVDYYFVTTADAALCFGDSGGAVYKEAADGTRVLIGINSRGNISTTSYLSNTFGGAFAAWATKWALANGNLKICGLHSDATGCRATTPPTPPVPPKPSCTDKLNAVKSALSALEQCVNSTTN